MIRWIFLFAGLLVSQAWARPPAEVVRRVYEVHLQEDRLDRTVARTEDCFTPGFLGIIERALARKPGSGAWVDIDFLTYSQGGWGDFEIGAVSSRGQEATVQVQVWSGLRSHGPDGPLPPAERKAMRARIQPQKLKVSLVDLGQGFQIKDLEFAPSGQGDPPTPAFQVRAWLKQVADHP